MSGTYTRFPFNPAVTGTIAVAKVTITPLLFHLVLKQQRQTSWFAAVALCLLLEFFTLILIYKYYSQAT
jgi:chromate transport protein ChrA